MHRYKRTFNQQRARIFQDSRHDTYRERQKPPEPTLCNECGALFTKGRWTWDDIPDEVHDGICPACRRIADRYPAGIIELSGPFFDEHRSEIGNMIDNLNKQELSLHPLERLMETCVENDRTVVTTTGMHLARRIGDALYSAYEGELTYNYDDENLVRVYWHR